MKRFLALMLAACMVMTVLASCGTKIDNIDTPVDTPDTSDNVGTDSPDTPIQNGETYNGLDLTFVKENGIEYIWERLSDDMKQNLGEVMNAIKRVDFSVTLTVGVPSAEVRDFLDLVYSCCTAYVYIGTRFIFTDEDGDGIHETMCLPYNYAVAEHVEDAERLTADLGAKLDEIVAKVPAGETEWNRIKFLHDYLVFNTNYGEDASLPFTAYGAIVENMATCQGYSDAMHLLLRHAGFEAAFVVGHGDSTAVTHKWNYVKLSDGKWYILDPTWADPAGKDDPDYICYDYFMIDDATLALDHAEKFESIYYKAPVADSMELSYHHVMGYYCTSYEEAKASTEKQIASCVENGTRYIYLRLSDMDVFTQVRQNLLMTAYGAEIKGLLIAANENGANLQTGRWGVYPKSDGTSPLTIIVTLHYEGEE